MSGSSVAPDLDRAWILGGFCVLAMTVWASLVVVSEPITFNIQTLITHLIIVISPSHTHICVQHLKDYNFGLKNLHGPETSINIILVIYYVIKLFKYQ